MFTKAFYYAQDYLKNSLFESLVISTRIIDTYQYVELIPGFTNLLKVNCNVAFVEVDGKSYLPVDLYAKMYQMALTANNEIPTDTIWVETINGMTVNVRIEKDCCCVYNKGAKIYTSIKASDAVNYVRNVMPVVIENFDDKFYVHSYSGQCAEEEGFESENSATQWAYDNDLIPVPNFSFLFNL